MQQEYYRLHLIRECEERIRKEYATNEIKTPTHLGVGGEAIAVGIHHVYPDSCYFGTYRNHALYLGVGGDLDKFWGELYGKETGCAKGKAGSMHLSDPAHGLILTSAVVGTTIPIGVGSAFASSYKRESSPKVTVSFFGDGATEEGVFHESLNFASLHQLPILFVCEDNDLAIHNLKENRQKYDLQKLVESYGIVYRTCRGEDIDSVVRVAKQIKPLLSKRPCFLHTTYHRFYEHVGPNEDYEVGYRKRPVYPQRVDPLFVAEESIFFKSLLPHDRKALKALATMNVNNAVLRAKEAKFAGREELLRDIYED